MVRAITSDGETFCLNRDFNIKEYSGEVTRRFVLNGPESAHLPVSSKYVFQFLKDDEVVVRKTQNYEQSTIDPLTDVQWERRCDDLYVSWTPPEGKTKINWYKLLVWSYDAELN
jgi:hypothetical protein